ncbi:unnamed protein product [Haemonchus placei]|uniref:Nuclear pore complex protein n=1 Tax=Haemonchus placei TaxID=6290 RepID=A0A0N4X844_HAEPC|nr:unnamed protein product [Haemonchus placei]
MAGTAPMFLVSIMHEIPRKVRERVDFKAGTAITNLSESDPLNMCSLCTAGWDQLEMGQFRLHSSSFGTDDFMLIMKFLLDRVVPSFQRNQHNDDEWLMDTIETLYAGRMREDSANKSEVERNLDIMEKWRRGLAHVANYCIENRMKTPLGKPMDTFNKLGGELLRLAKEAISGTPTPSTSSKAPNHSRVAARDKGAKDDEEVVDVNDPRSITPAEEWWRVRCLLEFVESRPVLFQIFEKLMYYVNSGTMFPICNVSVVIRFGTSALADLEKKQMKAGETPSSVSSQSMAILCWMARAMAELGMEQAVHGLSAWTSRVYHTEMPFLAAIAEIAAARYERSLVLLRKCIEDESLPETFRGMLRDIRVDVLSRLRHPVFLDSLSCPAEFSLWTEAEKSEGQVPTGMDAETFTRLKQLSMYGKVEAAEPSPGVSWNLVDATHRLESKLLQTLRRAEVASMRENVANTARLVLMTDGGQRLHGRLAALNHIAGSVLRKMGRKGQIDSELNAAVLSDLAASFLVENGETYDAGERLRLGRQLALLKPSAPTLAIG